MVDEVGDTYVLHVLVCHGNETHSEHNSSFYHGPTMFHQGRYSLQLAAMLVKTELTVGDGDYGQGALFSVSSRYFSHSQCYNGDASCSFQMRRLMSWELYIFNKAWRVGSPGILAPLSLGTRKRDPLSTTQ